MSTIKESREEIEKAAEEARAQFDGLYAGWFTPEELDLALDALEHYGEHLHEQGNHDKAASVFNLLIAMSELKEEGEVDPWDSNAEQDQYAGSEFTGAKEGQ